LRKKKLGIIDVLTRVIHWCKFGARWSSSSGGTRKILFGAGFH
jgi:hypothetical protein